MQNIYKGRKLQKLIKDILDTKVIYKNEIYSFRQDICKIFINTYYINRPSILLKFYSKALCVSMLPYDQFDLLISNLKVIDQSQHTLDSICIFETEYSSETKINENLLVEVYPKDPLGLLVLPDKNFYLKKLLEGKKIPSFL